LTWVTPLQAKPDAADADAVTQGLAVAQHEIEAAVPRVDHNGARLLAARIAHDGAPVRRPEHAGEKRLGGGRSADCSEDAGRARGAGEEARKHRKTSYD